MLSSLAYVACGGALGALARYGMVQLAVQLHPTAFPYATLIINMLGCLLMGILMAFLSKHAAPQFQLFLTVGVLGGFTTFSAFSWDALQLLQRGEMLQAFAYILASVIGSLLAVALGWILLAR